MRIFCNGRCRKIALSNIIKNKENFSDEETWWQIWGHEISGKEKVHSEKLRFEVKDKVEDFVSDEENWFVNGRWEFAILLFFGQ